MGSDCGGGDDFGRHGAVEGGAADDARRVHLEEADMEADGAGHQEVVVLAVDCAERSVGLALVGEELVDAPFVALLVEGLADDFYERGDYHWLSGDISVEAVLARGAAAYVVLGLAAGV